MKKNKSMFIAVFTVILLISSFVLTFNKVNATVTKEGLISYPRSVYEFNASKRL